MIVQWMLEELGEPYETVILDLESEQHKTADYLAINPMGKVPALVHGDAVTADAALGWAKRVQANINPRLTVKLN